MTSNSTQPQGFLARLLHRLKLDELHPAHSARAGRSPVSQPLADAQESILLDEDAAQRLQSLRAASGATSPASPALALPDLGLAVTPALTLSVSDQQACLLLADGREHRLTLDLSTTQEASSAPEAVVRLQVLVNGRPASVDRTWRFGPGSHIQGSLVYERIVNDWRRLAQAQHAVCGASTASGASAGPAGSALMSRRNLVALGSVVALGVAGAGVIGHFGQGVQGGQVASGAASTKMSAAAAAAVRAEAVSRAFADPAVTPSAGMPAGGVDEAEFMRRIQASAAQMQAQAASANGAGAGAPRTVAATRLNGDEMKALQALGAVLVRKPGAGAQMLTVLSDPLCPSCREFEKLLPHLAPEVGIRIVPVAFQRGAAARVSQVLCAADPLSAWKSTLNDEAPKTQACQQGDAGAEANNRFFASIGASATPTLVAPDGTLATGAADSAEQLNAFVRKYAQR